MGSYWGSRRPLHERSSRSLPLMKRKGHGGTVCRDYIGGSAYPGYRRLILHHLTCANATNIDRPRPPQGKRIWQTHSKVRKRTTPFLKRMWCCDPRNEKVGCRGHPAKAACPKHSGPERMMCVLDLPLARAAPRTSSYAKPYDGREWSLYARRNGCRMLPRRGEISKCACPGPHPTVRFF